jgi:hypothetical protein
MCSCSDGSSQELPNAEMEYNPFLTQSQQLSEPGPSNQPSSPHPDFTTETKSLSRKRGRQEVEIHTMNITTSQMAELVIENQLLPHAVVEEVPSSQELANAETEYNPVLTQSQQLSEPGPSNQPSSPDPAFTTEPKSLPRKRGRPDDLTKVSGYPDIREPDGRVVGILN